MERKALFFYNELLKSIRSVIGLHPLSTSELNKYGKKYIVGYMGTFARDLVPDDESPCIINLDDSSMSGSHWVARVDNIVYDSFGREFKDIADDIPDSDAEQELREIDCGHRCLAWLMVYVYFGREYAMLI